MANRVGVPIIMLFGTGGDQNLVLLDAQLLEAIVKFCAGSHEHYFLSCSFSHFTLDLRLASLDVEDKRI